MEIFLNENPQLIKLDYDPVTMKRIPIYVKLFTPDF